MGLCYSPFFVNICIDTQSNRKAVFPAYSVFMYLCSLLCLYAFSWFECITGEVLHEFQLFLVFEFPNARNAHSPQRVR
jgi:hypothetical protein